MRIIRKKTFIFLLRFMQDNSYLCIYWR